MKKKKKLFCEISPTTYAISLKKEILKRHIKNLMGSEKYATRHDETPLPVVVHAVSGNMIKRGPGIDPLLQQNKADNIRLACSKINRLVVNPGETFSFWQTVGKTSRKNGSLTDAYWLTVGLLRVWVADSATLLTRSVC